MKTLDILIKARALLASPERWCKGITFKFRIDSSNGKQEIAARCLIGAVMAAVLGKDLLCPRIMPEKEHRLVTAALEALLDLKKEAVLPGASSAHAVACWNDQPTTRHVDVLAWLDNAIAAVRAREQAERAQERMQALMTQACTGVNSDPFTPVFTPQSQELVTLPAKELEDA